MSQTPFIAIRAALGSLFGATRAIDETHASEPPEEASPRTWGA